MTLELALAGLSILPGGAVLVDTTRRAYTTTRALRAVWNSTEYAHKHSRIDAPLSTPSTPGFCASSNHHRASSPSSSPLPPTSPLPTSPPLRPLMLSTIRRRSSYQPGERPAYQQHHRGPSTMELGTTCTNCGSHVGVEVPRWMLSAIEGASTSSGYYHGNAYGDGPRHIGDEFGARASNGGQTAPRKTGGSRIDWRETVVHGAIGTAKAVKASPFPGLVLNFFRALFALVILLDARFMLHQRAAIVLSRFLEGLVEIEKEVGVMRGAGEALSIGWEATVKGVIAFAKADSMSDKAESAPATTTIFTRQHQPAPTHPHFSQARESSYFPPYQPLRFDQGVALFPESAQQQSVYPPVPPGSIMTEDDAESPRLGVDYSHETSCPPSPPPATQESMSSHSRPLRRTPLSSPALQTAYADGQQSSASIAASRSTNAISSSASTSTAFSALSSVASTAANAFGQSYPFLATDPAETLMPAYDRSTSSSVPSSMRSEAYHRPPTLQDTSLVRQRSRSGPGPSEGHPSAGGLGFLDESSLPAPPPPSPVGSRAGWAGKAMLGLAGRMKVI